MADQPEVILLQGDAAFVLAQLPAGCAQTCVTSPPYYGLRDYGVAGQLGGEATPQAYVDALVGVMREVRRVLSDDGTLWLNLGDSYNSRTQFNQHRSGIGGARKLYHEAGSATAVGDWGGHRRRQPGYKLKDLLGVPWAVASALREDGWWLRADIIWHKPNGMVEKTHDRPHRKHEYLFLLSKSPVYRYDKAQTPPGTVWAIPTIPYKGAHFATFPEGLVGPCVLAGSRPDDMVLDPFCGSGTVGVVARRLGRHAILIDLNPEYLALARERLGPP